MIARLPTLGVFLIAASCGSPPAPLADPPPAGTSAPPAPGFNPTQPATPIAGDLAPLTVSRTEPRDGTAVARAPVASITRTSATGYDVALRSDDEVMFQIDSRRPLPFAVGDTVVVMDKRIALGDATPEQALALLDERGDVIAAAFTKLVPVSGWYVERLATTPCQIGVEHGNTVASARIVIPAGGWYAMTAPDGAWAVSASCDPHDRTTVRISRLK